MATRDPIILPASELQEEWRQIPLEYNPTHMYEVSNLGRIRRTNGGAGTRGRREEVYLLKPWAHKRGYLYVELHRRCCKVHILVALAFIGPVPQGSEVNHIDGNKANNVVTNLEYLSHDDNMKHAAKTGLMERGTQRSNAKLTTEDVRAIRAARGNAKQKDLAKYYGVSEAYICIIQTRRKWAWLT